MTRCCAAWRVLECFDLPSCKLLYDRAECQGLLSAIWAYEMRVNLIDYDEVQDLLGRPWELPGPGASRAW